MREQLRESKTYLLILFVVLSTVALVIHYRANQPERLAENAARLAEDKAKGLHCMPWTKWTSGGYQASTNGIYATAKQPPFQVTAAVKARMNDGASYEPLGTSWEPQGNGVFKFAHEFSGKNAFGGRVRNTAIGTFDSTCAVKTLAFVK